MKFLTMEVSYSITTVVLVQTSLQSHATARNPCTYKYGNLCNDIFKTKFHMTARLPLLMKE